MIITNPDFFILPNRSHDYVIPHSLKSPSIHKTVTIDDSALRSAASKLNLSTKQCKNIIRIAFAAFDSFPEIPDYRKFAVKTLDPEKSYICELLYDRHYKNVTAYLNDAETFADEEESLSEARVVPQVTILFSRHKIHLKVSEAERVESINNSTMRASAFKIDIPYLQNASIDGLRKIYNYTNLDKIIDGSKTNVMVHFRQRITGTLSKLLQKDGNTPPVIETFKSLAGTLQKLKSSSLIHNFLNFKSIGLNKKSQPVIFDLTRMKSVIAPASNFHAPNDGFFAPEIIDAKLDNQGSTPPPKVETFASDMWAMGAIFYRLHTSKTPPFTYLEEAVLEASRVQCDYEMTLEHVNRWSNFPDPSSGEPHPQLDELKRLIAEMDTVLSSLKDISLHEMNDYLKRSLKPLFEAYCALNDLVHDELTAQLKQAATCNERAQRKHEALTLHEETKKVSLLFKKHLDQVFDAIDRGPQSDDPVMQLIHSMLARDPKNRIDPESLANALEMM